MHQSGACYVDPSGHCACARRSADPCACACVARARPERAAAPLLRLRVPIDVALLSVWLSYLRSGGGFRSPPPGRAHQPDHHREQARYPKQHRLSESCPFSYIVIYNADTTAGCDDNSDTHTTKWPLLLSNSGTGHTYDSCE
eukprot:6199770-Pleurochrysis_carterae.AAC.10